ncbi:MAG: phage/plasmid primase, P4 family [Clostridiales bacterium]|nr:phage/plasmid primase, P4 family [Clostridiales bacterium]
MSDYSLQKLAINAEEFLSAFFEPAEKVCLRVFSDRDGSAFSGQKMEIEQGMFQKIEYALKEHNNQNRGIFFVVNYGGHEDNQIKRVNAQFVEMDDTTLEEQLARVQGFPLEPSLIVKTRKSLHCYWLMKDASVERFRHIQKQLVAQFSGDPNCINESRVFRLPGFMHCKEEPLMVESIKFNPEIRYTQGQLSETLPEVPYEPVPAGSREPIREKGTQKGLVITGKRCLFLQHCKRNAKTLSEPDWYAMITNLALFEGGEDAIHKLSKPYPRYSYEQTQAKIDHFHQSSTKPMTCQRIVEQGFDCSRIGQCKCKAPAGLAYFPLDVSELIKALVSIKPKNNPALDIQLASDFISDYLFNVEPRVAEVFINNNIKDHFSFKSSDIKQLPAYYKELYNRFSATREARSIKAGVETPPWYEPLSNGKHKFLPGALADHLAETDPVIYVGESYYFYEGGVYISHNDKAAQRRVRSLMNSRYALISDIRDSEAQWQILIDKSVREINVNPYLLNFENGVYNLLTDELTPHDSKIMSTIRLGGKYDPNAECPVFLKYLSDVLPETEFPLVQEIMGYMMVPVNKAQKSFVLVGKPESGKSTLLYVVQDLLLRQENVSNLTWQALDEKFATVQLFGKLANIFADLPTAEIRDTGTFKAITGEDYISAQHKFKDYFSFKPFCRLLYSCNNIPKNYSDRSDGFYRRLCIIRFPNTITPEKRDGMLKEKLMMEKDGIIAWSMIGLKRLMENNYQFSETERTRSELANYKAENSSVVAFVEECCEVKPEIECLRDDLYIMYQEYCQQNGSKSVSQKRFNSEIESNYNAERGFEKVSRRKVFIGIRPQ